MYNSDEHSVPAKKSLGQHFLTSSYVPNLLCNEANIIAGEVVVEIGPGTGVLTKELLDRKAEVHATETDQRSCEVLQKRFAEEIKNRQLHIHKLDVREGFPDSLLKPHIPYKVVANIPYYLSGYLLRTFLDRTNQPTQIVFLIQKELAERIARDTKGSLLALSVRAFGNPHYVCTVGKTHFSPPPRVDSAIISITDIGHHLLPEKRVGHFFLVLHTGFAHKRKQLLSNLARVWPRNDLEQIFDELEIPNKIRAEDLALENWFALAQKLPPIDH